MSAWVVRAKGAIKGLRKRARAAYARRFHSFGDADFRALLQDLGVEPGDVLLVHSSLGRFEGFEGKPSDVITALEDAVGFEGALLMPTLPFSGTAVEWARKAQVFDAARTPSRMGLLTELFRRMPGVARSVHPTHPVAGWGRKAAALLADHHLARTPCGEGTPFGRLDGAGGKMLFLGTGIGVMTFFHAIEERLEPAMPFSPFTAETFTLACRSADGAALAATTRLFEPSVSRRRDLERLEPVLKSRGSWREGRLGGLDAILLRAADVRDAVLEMAAKGEYCYAD
jgi:aminoglycoside 3-N-acetyltransferase